MLINNPELISDQFLNTEYITARPLHKMREIIYIQAGSLSNHIGTHFWNAQQSYFTYSEDEEAVINHDISFREGLSPQVSEIPYARCVAILMCHALGRLNVLPSIARI